MSGQNFYFTFAILEGQTFSNAQLTEGYTLQNLLIDNNISNGTVLKFWGTIDPNPTPYFPTEYFIDDEGNFMVDDQGRFMVAGDDSQEDGRFMDPSEAGYSLIDYSYTVTADANKNLFITDLVNHFKAFTGIIVEVSAEQAENITLKGGVIKQGVY